MDSSMASFTLRTRETDGRFLHGQRRHFTSFLFLFLSPPSFLLHYLPSLLLLASFLSPISFGPLSILFSFFSSSLFLHLVCNPSSSSSCLPSLSLLFPFSRSNHCPVYSFPSTSSSSSFHSLFPPLFLLLPSFSRSNHVPSSSCEKAPSMSP